MAWAFAAPRPGRTSIIHQAQKQKHAYRTVNKLNRESLFQFLISIN